MNQVVLSGITKDDVQAIFEKVIAEQKRLPKLIYFDCSYLYNFHLDDFEHIRKFNLLCRYDMKALYEWHRFLEKWMCDEWCLFDGHKIKPIKIVRSFDRVVTEAMEDVAQFITGTGAPAPFKFHALGTGVFSEVTPADKALVNEISRIDVTTDPNGGTLARDGSTIHAVGNHPKSIAQGNISEVGIFNSLDTANDHMLDHSKFPTAITHLINQDVAGATVIVWQCSS